ncbi:MAG: Stealth CR1 domain-containing protein [Butyrivibrio sp.]|nr:Stealth CR1 domain-containing protein [Butyrivibrio sp.]
MDIDFVVTWVDGADPEWLKQKREYQVNQVAQMSLEEESKQFREWDTIRSLLSILYILMMILC